MLAEAAAQLRLEGTSSGSNWRRRPARPLDQLLKMEDAGIAASELKEYPRRLRSCLSLIQQLAR